MRRVCVIQARMGSKRLPGKVLREVAGKPLLSHIVRRLRPASALDELVVATSNEPADDAIAQLGRTEGVIVIRGSENDVLSRFVEAARQTRADVVVRVTGDCPLIDPQVVDHVVRELTGEDAVDYSSNVLKRTYPRGLDAEALFVDTLERVHRVATSPGEREHVTLTIRSVRPELFLTRSVESLTDDSDLRWTVDEEPDLELVRRLYDELSLADRIPPYSEIVRYVRTRSELVDINAGVGT